MTPGKFTKALLFAAAMIGLTGANPAPDTPDDTLTEFYQLNSLDIVYSGRDVLFYIDALSEVDDDGNNLTVSGLKTAMSLGFKNDEGGVFGANIPDIRPRFHEINFLEPGLNSYANVHLTVEADDGSDNRSIFRVEPGKYQRGRPFNVGKLVLIGENIPVKINGNTTGENRNIANLLVAETVNGGWTFKLALPASDPRNPDTCARRHIPTNGTEQLRPICERVIPY